MCYLRVEAWVKKQIKGAIENERLVVTLTGEYETGESLVCEVDKSYAEVATALSEGKEVVAYIPEDTLAIGEDPEVIEFPEMTIFPVTQTADKAHYSIVVDETANPVKGAIVLTAAANDTPASVAFVLY